MKDVAAIAVFVVAAASVWGWGWSACRATRVAGLAPPATIGVGLGVIVFLGGLLNLFGLVSGRVLDAVAVAGVVLCFGGLYSARRRLRSWRPTLAGAVAAVPLVVAGAAVVLWLNPPEVFNIHDDFEKYFSHPVRMLAAGTLTPNPLGSVGAETLGGQAFLQSFAVARWPIAYVGVVDAGFCFLLCVALASFGIAPSRWGLGALSAGIAVLVINPQVVNISSLFSGTALIMAAVLVTAAPAGAGPPDRRELLLALLYAGLVALKPTHVAFVGLHLAALAAAGAYLHQRWLRPMLLAVAATALFLSPWLLLHAPLYFAPAKAAVAAPAATASDFVSVFSRDVNGYGSSLLHYTLLTALCLAAATLAVIAVRRGWARASAPVVAVFAAALSAGLAHLAFMLVGGPLWFGSIGAARYATPLFLGVVPLVLVVFDHGLPSRWIWRAVPVAVALILAAGFWPSLVARVGELRAARTPLTYLADSGEADRTEFFNYNRQVLGGMAGSQLRAVQAFVPEGEKLAAWVMAPFHFNFRRNEVVTAEPAGLSMRWARWPEEVRYFLLQYRGYAVRSPAENAHALSGAAGAATRVTTAHAAAFVDEMQARSRRAKILYDDGTYVLMRFETERLQP